MTRTHEKVRPLPAGNGGLGRDRPAADGLDAPLTPATAALRVGEVLARLQGRWKLAILFQLFGGQVRRFSELERAIPAVSQKMLAQQLRQMEADGMVFRVVHPEVPPRVEYGLTAWGQSLCPTLDALLKWDAGRSGQATGERS
ncbi:MAG: transcriptional regulator [Haliea sp.]|nr:MAG: transcriptional regulator [Haliea sp.]